MYKLNSSDVGRTVLRVFPIRQRWHLQLFCAPLFYFSHVIQRTRRITLRSIHLFTLRRLLGRVTWTSHACCHTHSSEHVVRAAGVLWDHPTSLLSTALKERHSARYTLSASNRAHPIHFGVIPDHHNQFGYLDPLPHPDRNSGSLWFVLKTRCWRRAVVSSYRT